MPNGEKYIGAKYAVLFLGIGKLFVLLQGNSSAMLTFSKKYYLSLLVNFGAVFLGIMFNNYAIPKWGLEGASVATAFTWLASGFITAILIWKIYKMNPLTMQILYAASLFALLFGVNDLLQNDFNINHIVFGGLKTILIMGLSVISIYYFNLSDDVKSMLQKMFKLK
jgi:O-antigen/teichoic acid export membrane protein